MSNEPKKNVTNTATEDPAMLLMDMMICGSSCAIEGQERRGQAELVNADVLPTDGLISNRETLEAMGVAIGAQVSGDPLFTNVTLPHGWRKQHTDHSMWSDLVDERGRIRAAIFYKAAFYDRSAKMHPVTRFKIERDFDGADASNTIVARVLDGESVMFETLPVTLVKDDYKGKEAAEQAACKECKQWLADHGYPDFTNPAAYWDVP
jgi:hypothetical protein